jgi:hypothetical protein
MLFYTSYLFSKRNKVINVDTDLSALNELDHTGMQIHKEHL